MLAARGKNLPFITTLHGTDITLVGLDRSYLPITRFRHHAIGRPSRRSPAICATALAMPSISTSNPAAAPRSRLSATSLTATSTFAIPTSFAQMRPPLCRPQRKAHRPPLQLPPRSSGVTGRGRWSLRALQGRCLQNYCSLETGQGPLRRRVPRPTASASLNRYCF